MNLKNPTGVLLGIAVALLVLGCAHTPSELSQEPIGQTSHLASLQSVYAELEKSGGRVFTLAPSLSAIKIYVFRAGTAAMLGHNHVLSSPQFSGFIYLPKDNITAARFDLEFRLDQLEIDRPENRANLGSAFSSVPSAGTIKRTRDHRLGESNLQADRFPFVRIHSVQIAGEIPKIAANVQVELHGQQREMWLPLSVAGLPGQLSASGSLVLRQSDFGIQPYSVLGGFLAVQDELVIEFSLVGI